MPKLTPNADAPQMVARVRIGVVPDDDQFYGFCPDIGCIHVAADTEEEALKLAVDAVASYLVMSIRHGDPIPIGVMEQQSEIGEDPIPTKTAGASGGAKRRRPAKSFVRIPCEIVRFPRCGCWLTPPPRQPHARKKLLTAAPEHWPNPLPVC